MLCWNGLCPVEVHRNGVFCRSCWQRVPDHMRASARVVWKAKDEAAYRAALLAIAYWLTESEP